MTQDVQPTNKKVKPGLHLDIVITNAEHAYDHVLKRVLMLSAYRFQIFLVKYEYLGSLQQLTKAYGKLRKRACDPCNLHGDQALKRYTRRLQQLKEKKNSPPKASALHNYSF